MDRRREHKLDVRPGRRPLAAVLLAMAVGAVGDRYWPAPPAVWLAASAAGLAAWVAMVRWGGRRSGWLWLSIAATFAAHHHGACRETPPDALHLLCGERSTPRAVRLRIDRQPRASPEAVSPASETLWKIAASARAVRAAGHWRAASGRVQLLVEGDRPDCLPGDIVAAWCRVARPPRASNPGQFDQWRAARVSGRMTRLRADSSPHLHVLRPARWWSPQRLLCHMRQFAERQLQRRIQPAQFPLAAALLLGQRDRLTFAQQQQYRLAGVAHLLALSGLHVGLVAGAAWLAGRTGCLGRRAACASAAATAILYLLVAGARPPLLRATLLVCAVAGGRLLARPLQIWNLLAGAAIALLWLAPAELFEPGAQLSFLAVAALIRWGRVSVGGHPDDPLQRLVRESRPAAVRLLRAAVSLSLRAVVISAVVWAVTAPLAAWRFGLLAPVGVLLNPPLGLVVAAALYSSLGAILFAWCPLLADVAGALASWCLAVVELLAGQAASLPLGHYVVRSPPALWAIMGCGLWLAWGWPRGGRWRAACVTATAAAWLWWGYLSQQAVRPAGVQCTVLAVGHGACVVIRGPAGGVAMFDAGRLGGGAPAARTAVAALRQMGLRHVDHLLISHEDVDHFNAVPRLLQEIQVGAVWLGPRMLPNPPSEPPPNQPSGRPQPLPAEVARLKAAIADSPARLGHLVAGQTIQLDNRCRLHVLHPPAKWNGSADNADSLVVRIEFAGHSLLLTGDIEGPGLERLFRLAPQSDVLLAPHHGSPLSRPKQLAAQTAARWLIVSAGDPRVAPSVPGCEVFNTARDGAVRVVLDRSGVHVQSWRANPW